MFTSTQELDYIWRLANSVSNKYGNDVTTSIFAKYDAYGPYDLSSIYISDVVADLEMIIND